MQRVKKALVESFVGVVMVGWTFAYAGLHLANVLASPITAWIVRRQYSAVARQDLVPAYNYLQYALPELIKGVSLLVLGYVLLRWLYFNPVTKAEATATDVSSPR